MKQEDITFREKSKTVKPEERAAEPEAKQSPVAGVTDVEPPFTSWEHEKGHPYLVDYFNLGSLWKDKSGGFEREIGIIDKYIREEIERGRIDDSVSMVKELIKKIEKECNVNKLDRIVNRVAKIAAYTKFLDETRNL